MSAELLLSLAQGEGTALLQSVRLTVGQTEIYGAGDVAAYFRAHAVKLEGAALVSSPRHVAILAADVALVADVYDPNVARLWLVGPPYAGAAEPHVDVPFHLEMSQAPGGGLLGRAEDHLFLSPGTWPSVEKAALRLESELLHARGATLSARPVALRAFGDARRACALFAVHVKSGAEERRLGFAYAATLIEHGEASRTIRDPDGTGTAARSWTPRVET